MRFRHLVPVACLAITTFAVQAAQTTGGAAETDTPPAQVTHRSSQRGLRILSEVEQARQAIAAGQTQTALQHVRSALTMRTQLSANAQRYGNAIIIPLYWEFDQSSVLGRALASRNGHQKQPEKSAPVTVEAAGTQYTFVGLDLNKVERRLVAAQTALGSNDAQAADRSLRHITDELVVMRVQGEYPLLATRENLGLAELAIRSGHYDEAAAALKQASVTLDQYASGHSVHRPYEAKSLSKRIRALSQTIAQNHSGAAEQVDKWWNEVSGWFTHPLHG